MANLTASSTDPSVTWADTDGIIDWQMISGSGPLTLKSKSGGSYEDKFQWRHANTNRSFQNLDIETSEPTLLFNDTGGATYDARIRVNGGTMYFEENGTGSWVTNFQIDSDFAMANQGMVSGSTDRTQAMAWRLFTGALGGTSPKTIVVTHNSTKRLIQGATVMVTTSTADDTDATYRLYDYRSSALANGWFYVDIERGTAGGDDLVKIYFDTTTYGSTARYKIVAFYLPDV